MKEIFKNTLEKLVQSNLVAFVDRDRGQIDRYDQRPAIKFPTALLKVNCPQRENLNPMIQRVRCQIQIRLVFEKTVDQHSLNDAGRLDQALSYYSYIDAIESLFQGLKLGKTDKWECTSTVDEDRADFDVVKLTFSTAYLKEF